MAVDLLLERLRRAHPTGQGRWVALCPAHPDRTPSLSVRLEGDKILLHCFAGCPAERVLEAVGLTWADLHQGHARPWEAPGYYRPAPAPATPDAERVARWASWWDAAKPGHPLLARYLRARGLSLKPPPSLRLALWAGTPVMLARVEHPTHGLVGMHVTELLPDGSGRVSKRLAAGSKPLGGAIRLYALEPGQPLALCEGIETALAVHQATGWPAWACVSAGGLERVQLPAEAREVVIAADHDQAGLEAARKLARRLLSEGRKVRMAVPPRAGADWLDAVAGGAA
ncbi:toprim domain-containing protein [Calidithermus timidus]|uniref:toprim domain-containing protein n=1 Tax=Calidithermus timidus TaxID=307124 RepID=UPI000369B7C5|nr:toprim domain-containing protein [Calidithermus timidus]